MISGRRPLLPEILGQTDPVRAKTQIFLSIFARSASAVTPSEKSSINTNRKSTTRFSVSRWSTSYVAPKPPKGAQKPKTAIFRVKSATKLICVKNVSDKFVRHLLAYLSVYVPFYAKIWPLAKRRFSICFRSYSASAVTPSKLTLMGSSLRAFEWAVYRWTSYVAPKLPYGGLKTQNGCLSYKIARQVEESLLQSFVVWKSSPTKL